MSSLEETIDEVLSKLRSGTMTDADIKSAANIINLLVSKRGLEAERDKDKAYIDAREADEDGHRAYIRKLEHDHTRDIESHDKMMVRHADYIRHVNASVEADAAKRDYYRAKLAAMGDS